MGVPLIQLLIFHVFSYQVVFFFGTIGLLLTVSGAWKGPRPGKICAAMALFLFVLLALYYLYTLTLW
jgi:hypothetical protein